MWDRDVPGDLEEDGLGCRGLVGDPESCGSAVPSPELHGVSLGTR